MAGRRSPPRGVMDGIRKDFKAAAADAAHGSGFDSHGQAGAGVAWSHGFLNQKPWHPANYRNQRALYMAEEKHAREAKQATDSRKEFEAEQALFRQSALLTGPEQALTKAKQAVAFMYTKPPGLAAAEEREKKEAAEAAKKAAAAAAAADAAAATAAAGGGAGAGAGAVPAERLKRERDMYGRLVVTAEEFPMLKNAPVEDSARGQTGLHFRPFGVQLRTVQCMRCQAVGHAAGDAECPLRDALPRGEAERQRRQDPLAHMAAAGALRPAAGGAGGLPAAERPNFQLKVTPGQRSPVRGGISSDAANQQIVLAGEEEEAAGPGPGSGGARGAAGGVAGAGGEGSLLASLSHRERRALLKAYERREKARRKEVRRREREAALAFLMASGTGAAPAPGPASGVAAMPISAAAPGAAARAASPSSSSTTSSSGRSESDERGRPRSSALRKERKRRRRSK